MVNSPKKEPSSPADVPHTMSPYAPAPGAHMQQHPHPHHSHSQSPHRLSPQRPPYAPYSEPRNPLPAVRRSFSGESSSQRSSTGPSPSQNSVNAIVSKSYANMVNLSLNLQTPATVGQVPQIGQKDYLCMCAPTPKIPRPRNAFILYRQHHQAEVAANHPGLPNPEISKIIGGQWKKEPDDVKEQWKAMAEEEKLRHQRQYPEYRYQPRRTARPTGGRVGMDESGGTCPQCGGRMIVTPRTPQSAYPNMMNQQPGVMGPQNFLTDPRAESRDGPRRGHRYSLSIGSQGNGGFGDSPGHSIPFDEMTSSVKRRRMPNGGFVPSGDDPTPLHPSRPPSYGYQPQEQHAPGRYDNAHRGYNTAPMPPHSHGYGQGPSPGPTRSLGPAADLPPTHGQHRDYQGYHQSRPSVNEYPYPAGPPPANHAYGHAMPTGGPLPPLEISSAGHSISPASQQMSQRRPLPGFPEAPLRTAPASAISAPQPRFGDESLKLPPLKTQLPQHVSTKIPSAHEYSSNASNPESMSDTAMKGDDKPVLSIPDSEKFNMINRFAPPLRPSLSGAPKYDVRGAIVAVEGFDSQQGVNEVSSVVQKALADAHDVSLKMWSDGFSEDEDVTMGDDNASQRNDSDSFEAIKAYHDSIGGWLAKSREMIGHITTVPGSSDDDKTLRGADSDTDKSVTKTAHSPCGPGAENTIPVALVTGGYRATIATRYAAKVPLQDNISPTDHYEWMANMWRGVVGPDLIIHVVANKSSAVCDEASTFTMARPGMMVVRVSEQGALGESTARRLAFEVNEWVRGGSFRVGF